jgi:hypothetical protein
MLTMYEVYSMAYIIQRWGKAVVSCWYHQMVNAMSLQHFNGLDFILYRGELYKQPQIRTKSLRCKFKAVSMKI